ERGGCDATAFGVVAAIKPDLAAGGPQVHQWAGREALHPRRPIRIGNTRFIGGRLDPKSVDRAQCRNGKACIVELMAAEKSRRSQIQQAAIVLIDQTSPLDADMPLLPCAMQRRALTARAILDLIERVVLLMRANHRHAALDDPGLLRRDRSQCGAEKFDMVDAD